MSMSSGRPQGGLITSLVAWALRGVWLVAVLGPFRLGRLLGRLPRLKLLVARTASCRWCASSFSLYGAYICGACGSGQLTHAFARCVLCGARPLRVDCPVCGLAVPNPAVERWS